MTSIYPVPTGRISGLLLQRRLESQLHSNQLDLLRLQDQLSTGRRIALPSEDPAAAQRAIGIQRLLEQKTQIKTNLATSQTYLTATDSAIAGVAGLLTDVRAAAQGVTDAAHSDTERLAVIQQVRQAVERLTDIANEKFRDRYLFAGSTIADKPFAVAGSFRAYNGNEAAVRSYSNIDSLFDSSVSGQQVFGAISAAAKGTADLNPSLTSETKLVDLRGGAGLTRGPIRITDGTSSRLVDLSSAETLGDVARLIEANPPANRTLTVQILSDHLEISIDNQPGTNLTIQEADGGTTAAELGILTPLGAGAGPIVGTDLNPRLRLTTRLADILGGAFDQSGLQITTGGQTYTIDLSAAQTVEDVLNALNGSGANVLAEINTAGTGIDIRSRLSGADFQIGENGGLTAEQLGVRTFTRETRLADLNYGLGIQTAQAGDDFVIHKKDGTDLNVNLGAAATVGDVLDLINNMAGNTNPATAVVACLKAFGNGIELVDANAAGTDTLTLTKGSQSEAAAGLGLLPKGVASATATVQGGADVITGSDTNPQETEGVFNSLLRLQAALESSDQTQIDRALGLLENDLTRVSFARADLGARAQSLDAMQSSLEDEDVQLRDTLSKEIDADLGQTISGLTNKQTAVEASLRLIGMTAQLSLLDFL